MNEQTAYFDISGHTHIVKYLILLSSDRASYLTIRKLEMIPSFYKNITNCLYYGQPIGSHKMCIESY